MKTIRKGDRGDEVQVCQERLTAKGYLCTADGIFGANTDRLVRAFQKDRGLGVDGIVGPATWAALEEEDVSTPLSSAGLPLVLQRAQDLGYEIWEDEMRLWLFGIRSSNRTANDFDDTLGCVWRKDGLWHVEYWPGTTDPGTYYLTNQEKWFSEYGVAVLVADQYLDTWQIGMHAGKYEALCQWGGPVKLYRDGDLDNEIDLDPDTIKEGAWAGINLHASSSTPYGAQVTKEDVGPWSAGCQVHSTTAGFCRMMELAKMQLAETGRDTFSYTLLDEW